MTRCVIGWPTLVHWGRCLGAEGLKTPCSYPPLLLAVVTCESQSAAALVGHVHVRGSWRTLIECLREGHEGNVVDKYVRHTSSYSVTTVGPLNSGRHWDPAGCPTLRGARNTEVDLYIVYVVGTADGVLIREVSFIQSALYREVPLYIAYIIGMSVYAYVHAYVSTQMHAHMNVEMNA